MAFESGFRSCDLLFELKSRGDVLSLRERGWQFDIWWCSLCDTYEHWGDIRRIVHSSHLIFH